MLISSSCLRKGLQLRIRQPLITRLYSESGPAFVFDIDGVLKQGRHVLPQAKKALQILTGNNALKKQYPFILVTNGGGTLEIDRSIKLSSELGVEIAEHDLVQSHTVFRASAEQYKDKPVLIVGGAGDSCRDVANRYGFKHAFTPKDILHWYSPVWPFTKPGPSRESREVSVNFEKVQFAAIFVFHDSRDWGMDCQIIIDLIRSRDGVWGTSKDLDDHHAWAPENQLPVYFSNPDLLWGNECSQPRLGQGAFQESVASVYKSMTGYDLKRFVGGKPTRSTYDYAAKLLNEKLVGLGRSGKVDLHGRKSDPFASRVYMVGDNPKSDIAGANAYGWESILVRTGVFRGKENDPEHPATTVQQDVLLTKRGDLPYRRACYGHSGEKDKESNGYSIA